MTDSVLRAQYADQGFVLRPGVFAFDEIAWVRDEARIVALRRGQAGHAPGDESWAYEAPEGTLYGQHVGESVFRKLAAHPRLLATARELLGGDVYIHQSRLIPRLGESPADVLWRRDFATWSRADRMATPNAVTAAILLGDSAPSSPVLYVTPGSHRETDAELAGGGPAVPVAAALGSVFFYDANLAYALNQPGDRRSPALYLVSYNAVGNRIATMRDAIYAAHDVQPPRAEADDCMWPIPWCAAG
jgi:ectoine hydroxylase